jgi:HK97 family phage major capsid protein
MTRLQEIEKRMSAIKAEIETEGADLGALETEVTTLKEERKVLIEKIEKRKALLDSVAGIENPKVIENFEEKPEARKMEFNKDNVLGSPEYRSAFMKRLQKLELNEVEQRALTVASNSVGAAVPTQTAEDIVTKVKEYAPLLGEITLLYVPGGVKFAVEGTINDAALHTEGTDISASADTLITVTLGSYEITKLVTISKSVSAMSISTFEAWLVDMLAQGIANKISGYLITGTGSSQPTGIEKAQSWDATNSVTVALNSSLTAANVQTLCGLLKSGYDAGAKWIMSKKTLFTDFMPLQDNAKHSLVTNEGNKYYVYGTPVLLDERVTLHEAFLGNLKKAVVGNLAENINVVYDFDVKTNSFDYLGCAIFDSKIAVGEAVVKLVKATA